MKYLKGICLYISIIFSLSSCTNRNQNLLEAPTIVLDAVGIMKQGWMRLDSTEYRAQYIPLETNNNCLIGNIAKTLIFQDKIFVADFFDAMALFVFNLQGKFLYKINNYGNGPGEYLSFTDFDIHSNGDIYIYDVYKMNFLVYDSTGIYKEVINIDYQISSFCMMDNLIYCSELKEYGKILANLATYNINDKGICHILPSRELLDDYHYNSSSTFKFYRSFQHAYYNPKFSPVIYTINKQGVVPAIGLTNLQMPPEDVLKEWIKQPALMWNMPEYFLETTYIYETNRYIFFTINMAPTIFLLYDKDRQRYYSLDSLYPGIGISEIKGSTGDFFWGIMEPDEDDHKGLINMQKDLKEWKEEDNPVIVFIEFNI